MPLRLAAEFDVSGKDPDPRGLPVLGADGEVGGTVVDLWVDHAESLFRYLEVEAPAGRARAAADQLRTRAQRPRCRVRAILGGQFAAVPATRDADQVTLLEEEKIMAYYGAGTLYAEPSRQEPLSDSSPGGVPMKATHRHTTHGHEHEFEAEHGLPEALPRRRTAALAGRAGLARAGAPRLPRAQAGALLRRADAAARGRSSVDDGGTVVAALRCHARPAGAGAVALGLVALMAWLSARTTVYTLTDRRVVMRIGIVLTLTFNLPYKRIAAAGLRTSTPTATATSR